MCKRKIKSVEGLRRYRPYKLMNIASPYQDKSKLTSCCTAPIYVLYMSERGIESNEGLTEIQAIQTHEYCKSIQEILHFSKISHFLNFREKSKLAPRCTGKIETK